MEKLTYDVLPKELYEYWNQDKTECKKGDNENIINTDVDTKSKKISIKDKLTTAYALNLCTVSVSRIINCKDQYVMDQEYDAILNNLNIQNMPNDDSLLKILKQILDVITFFKIQEGDKKFIEEDYKQALKQNLSRSLNIAGLLGSVSSIGIGSLTTPGSIVKAGLSVASTIGIGYMNYRSGKTQALLNKKKQEWELQRSAIEQLNALRRELFDTAWNLTKNFDVHDEFRLTEHQIEQYLKILDDNDNFRRFERLDFIRDKFLAYPPFWYQLGHTAKLVSMEEPENREYYISYSKACFDFFMYQIDDNLLRDDQIASSCALEYSELLDESIKEDREHIEELLGIAMRFSGNRNDVLELCAIGYLRIGKIDKATRILWRLVNEKYDENFNAEMLSMIYYQLYMDVLLDQELSAIICDDKNADFCMIPVKSLLESQKADKLNLIRYVYDLLGRRTTEDAYLIPLPEDENTITSEGYLNARRKLLILKLSGIEDQIYEKYSSEFATMLIPSHLMGPEETVDVTDVSSWLKNKINQILVNKQSEQLINAVKSEPMRVRMYYALNDLLGCLGKYVNYSPELEHTIKDEIHDFVQDNEQLLKELERNIKNNSSSSITEALPKYVGLFDLQELCERLKAIITTYNSNVLNNIEGLDDICSYERKLYLFAKEFDFNVPIIPHIGDEITIDKKKEIPYKLDPSILNIDNLEEYERSRRLQKDRLDAIVAIFNEVRDDLLIDSEKVLIRVQGDNYYDSFIENNADIHNEVPIAVIYSAKNGVFNLNKKTLVFSANGIYWLERGVSSSYSNITFDDKKRLIINGKAYANDNLDADVLRDLIARIRPIIDELEEFNDRKYYNEELIEQNAIKVVKMYTNMAIMNGMMPGVFLTASGQIQIQVAMMYSIARTFKLNITKKQLKELVIEMLKASSKTVGKETISNALLSLIPGVGVVKSVMSASIMGALTHSLGVSFIEYCKTLISRNAEYLKSEEFIKDGVSYMQPKFAKDIVVKESEIEEVRAELNAQEKKKIEDLRQELMCTGQEVAEAARQLTESAKTIKEMNESTSDLIDNTWNSLDDRRKHLEEMKNDRK